MKKVYMLLFLGMYGGVGDASAQINCPPQPVASYTLHANRFRVQLHLSGVGAVSSPGMEVDLNGGAQFEAGVSASNIWVGGIDPGGSLPVAGATFPNGSNHTRLYNPGPLNADGYFDPSACANWNHIWGVKGYQVYQHYADLADNGQLDFPITEILGWPGRGNPYFSSIHGFELPTLVGLAPFYDADVNGIYDPYAGDFPAYSIPGLPYFPGDLAWSYANTANFATSNFEIRTASLAYACEENNLLNDVWFQEFVVINREKEDLDSMFFGFWFDPELGDPADDYFGFDSLRETFYVYNADDTDANTLQDNSGFGKNPPVLAVTLLNNYHELPLSGMYYNRTNAGVNPATADPTETEGFFNYLTGSWRDGTPLTYGGTGYEPNNPLAKKTRIAFDAPPSDPGGWSMRTANMQSLDRAALMVFQSEPFPPGGVAKFTLMYSLHRDTTLLPAQQVDYMLQRVDSIRQLIALFDIPCNTPAYCVGSDCVWPGDTDQNGKVEAADVLGVGFARNNQGPSRTGFVNWQGQNAPNWPQAFNPNTNYKHIDANGDGRIEDIDAGVVDVYYGFTTPSWKPLPDVEFPGDALVWKTAYSQSSLDSFLANKVMNLGLWTGSVSGLTGLSYTIELDTQYWRLYTFTLLNETNDDHLVFKKYSGNAFDGAFVQPQNDPLTTNFYIAGGLLQAKPIASNLPDTTYIRVKNVHGITTDGHIVRLGGASLPVRFAKTTINTQEPGTSSVVVYPNPASNVVHILASETLIRSVQVMRSTGALVSTHQPVLPTDVLDLDVAQLSAGLYFLRIETESGATIQKCIID